MRKMLPITALCLLLAGCATPGGREVMFTADPAHIMTAAAPYQDTARCMVEALTQRKIMLENVKVDVRESQDAIDGVIYYEGSLLNQGRDLGYFRTTPAGTATLIKIWPMQGAKKAPDIIKAAEACNANLSE